ncbi:MAG: hypothetical protein GWM98_26195 [Nitrospinaceae bacterium]|nr:flagellar brake protein [Nitrospinaceae bacterium]NIR57320.1 flagellar brake protein [Nitrospinaceae bacterium]NIS87772.1 flagellar brake protein [Nitrospinaceae bacterium]NIT84642.1 flagellar brake protein [Nitrospinaceae bacterium]NIU46821.1 flagellar brake protein [Nitrospinaceae bacterium]
MKTVTKTGLYLTLGRKIHATIRGERYQVAIRGWMENEYIIVDYPHNQGKTIKVAPLTGCHLSYTSEGSFFDFKTLVLYALSQPVRLMVLEYPKSFTTYNLRKNNRQKTNYSFYFTREEDPPEVTQKGTIRDLSLSGALITHSAPLIKGKSIILTVNLSFGEVKDLQAQVRNIRKNPQSKSEPYVTGLEFVKPNREQDKVLRKFMESRMGDRRKTGRPR